MNPACCSRKAVWSWTSTLPNSVVAATTDDVTAVASAPGSSLTITNASSCCWKTCSYVSSEIT